MQAGPTHGNGQRGKGNPETVQRTRTDKSIEREVTETVTTTDMVIGTVRRTRATETKTQSTMTRSSPKSLMMGSEICRFLKKDLRRKPRGTDQGKEVVSGGRGSVGVVERVAAGD